MKIIPGTQCRLCSIRRYISIYGSIPPGSAHPGNETDGQMDRRKVTEVGIFSIENLKFYTQPKFISVRKEQIFY